MLIWENEINSYEEETIFSEYEKDYILSIKDIKPESYPIFSNSINWFTLYYDIHSYLLSKLKGNKNKIYPEYINTINDEDNIISKKNNLDIFVYIMNYINIMKFVLENLKK